MPSSTRWPQSLAAALLLGCLDVVTITSGTDAALRPGGGVVCAGVRCAPGAVCCLLTGRCFDPSTERASCAIPDDAGVPGSTRDPGQSECVSNADCRANELCQIRQRAVEYCLGLGVCELRANAGTCGGACQVCGCDGVTYPSRQAAWNAGVNAPYTNSGPCGGGPVPPHDSGGLPERPARIPCGLDSQCPAGSACCAVTGNCYDPAACPRCCAIPPAGTAGPCEQPGGCPPDAPFCRGGPACDAPGFCVPPRGNCGGQVAMICGCDGVTYTNDCWAELALTRVAHAGACP
jgi:hypothetical protein